MNPASASTDPLPPLGLTWGIKRSFIAYITNLPDGTVAATGGAAVVESTLFCFAPADSDYDAALGTGVLRFRGDVRLGGHHGMLFVRILDPWIAFTGGRGVLSISTGGSDPQDRIAVGFLHASAPREVEDHLVWEDVEVAISPEGAELFDGQYAAQQPMDPLLIRVKA